MLAEPAQTQFDLNFQLPTGVRVRVSVFFWVAALVIGWRHCQTPTGQPDPSQILIFTAAMFVSILLHELGHVLAFRRYGIMSYIVLYHFGGLAVPETSSYSSSFGGGQLDSKAQIVVSAAGPGFQLLLALAVVALCRASGVFPWYLVEGQQVVWMLLFVDGDALWGKDAVALSNPLLNYLVADLLFINIFWALLNLLPIYPLDGGKIARELCLMFDTRTGVRNSLVLSIVTAVGIALLGLATGQIFVTAMFGMFAFSSYQMLQMYQGRGGGFGGGGFGGGGGYGGGGGWR